MAEALEIQPVTLETLYQLFINYPINNINENKVPEEEYTFCQNCDINFNYFFDLTKKNETIDNFRSNVGLLRVFFHNLQKKLSINVPPKPLKDKLKELFDNPGDDYGNAQNVFIRFLPIREHGSVLFVILFIKKIIQLMIQYPEININKYDILQLILYPHDNIPAGQSLIKNNIYIKNFSGLQPTNIQVHLLKTLTKYKPGFFSNTPYVWI
jgi:hypothetical protein